MKRNMFIHNLLETGQSLFEVVIAIGVAAVVLVGAVSLSTVSLRNTDFSKNNAIATKYAQEGGEWLRQQRDESWDTFRSNTDKTCLGSLSWGSGCSIDNIFSRSISFICYIYTPPTTAVTACSNAATNMVDTYVTVTWKDGNGTHEVKNVSTLTRWRN